MKSGVKTKKKKNLHHKNTRMSTNSGLHRKNCVNFYEIWGENQKKRLSSQKLREFPRILVFFFKNVRIFTNSEVISSILGVSGLELNSSSTEPVKFFGVQSSAWGEGTILVWGSSSGLGAHGPRIPPSPRTYAESNFQLFRFYSLLVISKSILIGQNSRTKTKVESKLSSNWSSRKVPMKNFLLKTKRNLSEQNRSTKTYRNRPIQIALCGYTSQIQLHNPGRNAYETNIPNTKISKILKLPEYYLE